MKIGFLVPSIYMQKKYLDTRISAPMHLALTMVEELVKRKHEVYFFAAPDVATKAHIVSADTELLDETLVMDYQQDIPAETYKTLTLYETKKYYELGLTKKAYEFAQENKIEVMHVYHTLSNFAHYFVDTYNVPTVFTLHILPPDKGTLTHWRYNKFKHQNFVAITTSQKNSFQNTLPGINITDTVYHGVDTDKYKMGRGEDNNLIFIGRCISEKGIDTAMQAAIKTNKNIAVGTWINPVIEETDFYKKDVGPLVSHGNVTMLGLLSPSAVIPQMGKSKAFVLPLRWEEPFGMVVIEAMAAGTPVIAYSKGGLSELIKDGETGFLINSSPEDIRGDYVIKKTGFEGLCEAIEKIYSMPENEYQPMRSASRAHAEKYFSVKAMVDEYERVYKKISEQREE